MTLESRLKTLEEKKDSAIEELKKLLSKDRQTLIIAVAEIEVNFISA